MLKRIFLFSSFLIFTFSLAAQEKADYRQKFTEGNYLILEGNYALALTNFKDAYAIDSLNANINFKVGLCYLKSETEKNKALYFLEKAVKNTSKKYNDLEPTEKTAPVNAYYYYGQALHFNYKFDDAIANFEKFKSFLRDKNQDLIKEVDRQIEISKNAKSLVNAPINIILKNLGDSINTPAPEYSPVLSADEKTLMFTSRRVTGTGTEKTDDGQYFEDIYVAYKKSDSTWTSPISVSSNINTTGHEASVGLTADAQTLLIYKDVNGGDIYFSSLNGDNWSFPQAMGSDINTSKWETSACLSPDGNTLYFVSDREGGLGGRDIWKCVKLPNGKWSLAVNVGAPINTIYDEESPFIHPSGNVLFFSSKGHNSIGGFDIFFSSKNEETNGWEEPLNIGYPINTTDDDVFYVTSPDGKRGYYSSSSRPEGYGEKDIYMISLPERKEVPLVLIKGIIIPVEGQKLPPDLEIVATNNETGIVAGVYKPMLRDGSFTIIIPPGSNYTLSYTNDGQEFFSEIVDVPMSAAYQEINRALQLKGVSIGTPTNDTTSNTGSDIKTSVKANPKHTTTSKHIATNNNSNEVIVTNDTTSIAGSDIKTSVKANPKHTTTSKHIATNNNSNEVIVTNDTTSNTSSDIKTSVKSSTKPKHLPKAAVVASNNNNPTTNNNVTKENIVPPLNHDQKNVSHEQLATVDKLNFQMFFKYNVTEIDVLDGPFKEYIDNLAALVTKNGSININLTSCASQVPTRAYKSNKDLSIDRAEKAKAQIIAALKEKGIDASKIIFVKVKSFVSGPQYNIDYLINKAEYEKFQYIKVSAY